MNAYKAAGVDVEAGYEAVKLMKKHVSKTFIPGVLSDIGGFGGLFEIDKNSYKTPVLVSGTDGVGTKLKIAFIMDKHDTVGQDCVAMCVNDIVCSGAKPLFFLDYLAVGKNKPEQVAKIVKGVADGCVQAGCALIGGETAEMPGFYSEGEYDLAGFAVGIVDKEKIIDGSRTQKGNLLIGLASSGIHSNGYSLVRKLFNLNGNNDDKKLDKYIESLGCTVGEEILKPTRIYVKVLHELIEKYPINAVSHITGGGFIENIPRMLPKNLKAKINKGSWEVHPVFELLKSLGNIAERDMFNTFNMGIGMVLAVDDSYADQVIRYLEGKGEKAFVIGEVVEGENGVDLC
ncbi:MAG: phosphoribosylformylglycinamidine cyclo-ligase [Clostridiales bacterium]|jgi:phosphoribosylformylglycinamidine cyclo-ligase|nr:phosphoribosylformylglycinamidine cyclo-ligase [Clostridiales bacterium]MDK2934550.1 phosphoribosylformylglycinamidine cyclo-ligase [Clostridiales bacterium]